MSIPKKAVAGLAILCVVFCGLIPGAEKLPQKTATVQLLLSILKETDKTPVAGARVEYSWKGTWIELRPAEGDKQAVSSLKFTTREIDIHKKKQYKINYSVTGKVGAKYLSRGKTPYPPTKFRVMKKGCEPGYFAPRRGLQSRDGKFFHYQQILLKPERIVTVSLNITNARDTKPVAGAHVQYYDLYASSPRWEPALWRDLTRADGTRILSSNTYAGNNGNKANFVYKGHVPDPRFAERREQNVIFRIVREGFENKHFLADRDRLWKDPSRRAEISLRPLGCISHWPIEKGTGKTVSENTGLSNPGRISGAEWHKDGSRTALKFDGEDDSVDFGTSPVYEQVEAITVLLWIKPQKDIMRMESVIGRAWRNPFGLYTRKGNGLEVSIFLGNYKGHGWYTDVVGGSLYCTKSGIILPGQWNMVGFSYDRESKILQIFHNGKIAAKSNTRQGGAYLCSPSSQPLSIGCFDGMTHFKGLMDDVRMYNYALSEEEVKKIYEGSK